VLSAALGAERSRVISVCGAGGKTTLVFALAREFAARGARVLVTTTTKMAREEAHRVSRILRAASAREVLEGAAPGERGVLLAYSSATASGRKLDGFAPEVVDALAQSGAFDRIVVEADGAARRHLKAAAAHEPVIARATDLVVSVAGLHALGRPLGEEHVFRAEIWARLTGTALGTPVGPESIAAMALHPEGFFKDCPPGARRTLLLNRADTPERLHAARRIRDLVSGASGCGPQRVTFVRDHLGDAAQIGVTVE
jgi:probable selenium-dependent hydroxylase accessory protein YqeC